MPIVEIIAIGTELLLGEIQDTNTRYLARHLRDAGIDIFRATIVGDNAQRIAKVIQESLTRADIVITTGGLGPTVDDPTRQAVAIAVNRQMEYREDLWLQIQDRFKRYGRPATENNRRQAYVPAGAISIENQVGTAPAFIVEQGAKSIISLPGVPREMEYLYHHAVLPFLLKRYQTTGIIKAVVLHAAGVGESQVDEWIGDLETLPNPTVGLLAHPGQVDIRVTAKADSEELASLLMENVITSIQERVGEAIYGMDDETLEGVIQNKLVTKGWSLGVVEAGLSGALPTRLLKQDFPYESISIGTQLSENELITHVLALKSEKLTDVNFGISYIPGEEKQLLHLYFISPEKTEISTKFYGGPPGSGPAWALNLALDFLRRNIQ